MFKLNKIIQNFTVSDKNKKQYGEVHTDFGLITKILDLIPKADILDFITSNNSFLNVILTSI